jgi:hypothetical protein
MLDEDHHTGGVIGDDTVYVHADQAFSIDHFIDIPRYDLISA